MYRKTPPNISQSAKGPFKLKHFGFFSKSLSFERSLVAPELSPSSWSCWRWQLRSHLPCPSAEGLQQIGTKCCFTEHWCISETQNDSNPSVLSSTWTQAFAFLVKHLIWTLQWFFHHWTHSSPTHSQQEDLGSETPAAFFFLSFFFFNLKKKSK